MAKDQQFDFELALAVSTPSGRRDSQEEIDKGEEHGAMLQRRCSEGESQ